MLLIIDTFIISRIINPIKAIIPDIISTGLGIFEIISGFINIKEIRDVIIIPAIFPRLHIPAKSGAIKNARRIRIIKSGINLDKLIEPV